MRRRAGGERDDAVLEALDPVTGQGVVEPARRRPHRTISTTDPADGRRARRLLRLRAVLVVLSLASLAEAGYFLASVRSTRALERTWRSAMAVDEARDAADDEILQTLQAFDDDDSADALLTGIGVAALADYRRAERSLAGRRIADRRVRALRDRMVDALRFRQLQMSPSRRRLGDTPLVLVEQELASLLRRWGLAPTPDPPARLIAADAALERLRRFTDTPTGAILVALEGDGLVTVDVDADRLLRRRVPVQIDRLLTLGRDTVVVSGPNGAIAYGLDPEQEPAPRWERPGAFAVGPAGSDGIWLEERRAVVRMTADGPAGAPVPLPPRTAAIAATADHVVLSSAGSPGQRLELWDPSTGVRTLLAPHADRLVGVGQTTVVLDAAGVTSIVDQTGTTIRVIDLPAAVGDTAERPADAARPEPLELAAAVGPLAGRIAAVLRIQDAAIVPVTGPRTGIFGGSLAWSPSGAFLFWVTPDGHLAVHDAATRRSQVVRAPLHAAAPLVAFPAPR